ncbi:2767_t:CDS:2, partial [Gigaspora margarita]
MGGTKLKKMMCYIVEHIAINLNNGRHITNHSCRRTAIQLLRNSGLSEPDLQAFSGHCSRESLADYCQLGEDQRITNMELLIPFSSQELNLDEYDNYEGPNVNQEHQEGPTVIEEQDPTEIEKQGPTTIEKHDLTTIEKQIPTITKKHQEVSFIPVGRIRQSSVLVENKLYFFGSDNDGHKTDNIYLDVNPSSLDINQPKWTDLTQNAQTPSRSPFASACVGGANKDIIFLLGHLDPNNSITNYTIVYTFNTTSQIWSIPQVNGPLPLSRQQFQAVSDRFKAATSVVLNDIFIFDSLNLIWIQGPALNAPPARVDFSATLLNNGLILYLGSTNASDTSNYNIRAIPAYNTNTNDWTYMPIASDFIPAPRNGHSAVLSPDGFVIVYGGNGFNTSVFEPLVVLDTNVSPYKWYNKSIIGTNIPPRLVYHTASMIGSHMILVFGTFMLQNGSKTTNSNIYIFDTRNYIWVTSVTDNNDIDTSIMYKRIILSCVLA